MMNKKQVIEQLQKLDMHPSRRLGQNFLVDGNMLNALAQDAQLHAGQRVLEIGPGLGMLTDALLAAGCSVTAVELDHRLAAFLRERYASNSNLRLVEGDACRQDFDEIMGTEAYRCVANLPYSCSTPFLANIASAANPPLDLCVLLQREMAERLVAGHGTKDYGLPTVKVALRYSARVLRTVPPSVFFPPPEVTSSFVRLELNDRCDAAMRALVERVATAAFAQRRKKAITQIAALFPTLDMQTIFARAGMAGDVRADGISVNGYIELSRLINTELEEQK
ncbi:MAG: ribosomal RNA small subunit methyltransferase A [Victivallales bacterium]|nr:ribosomal RNA small subunit methyltransferase A [Victivallales bacterium]